MEEISVLQISDIIARREERTRIDTTKPFEGRNQSDPVIDMLNNDGGENFYNYLNWNGLAKESNMLILPSSQHYYYDNEDLKGVTTLINLKKLNLIRHLDDFINNVYSILSPKANFIGCFTDRKTNKGASLASRLYKRFINFLDLKIDIEIDRKDISRLLQSRGFKIIDMTEINGLTYFRTQNSTR